MVGMRKKIIEGIHLVVEPATYWGETTDSIFKTCERIKRDINRHVDNVDCVSVQYESRYVCSFCGQNWEECEDPNNPDWIVGQPLCCDKAIEEWDKKKGE